MAIKDPSNGSSTAGMFGRLGFGRKPVVEESMGVTLQKSSIDFSDVTGNAQRDAVTKNRTVDVRALAPNAVGQLISDAKAGKPFDSIVANAGMAHQVGDQSVQHQTPRLTR